MKYIKNVALIITLSLTILPAIAAQKSASSDPAIEQAILAHINQYRQQHGLSTLVMDARISKEARIHSQEMAKHSIPFGHIRFQTRIKHLHEQIKDSNAGAENVAYNYRDGADVVKNWLKSPGHKANIDGNYTHTGIGIARDSKGKIYFTQMFLKRGNGSKYADRRTMPKMFHIPFLKVRA